MSGLFANSALRAIGSATGSSQKAGIKEHLRDGVTVKVINPEKTLADGFKLRNKIGMDVALEALKLYKERKKFNLAELLKYARFCRIEKAMKPLPGGHRMSAKPPRYVRASVRQRLLNRARSDHRPVSELLTQDHFEQMLRECFAKHASSSLHPD